MPESPSRQCPDCNLAHPPVWTCVQAQMQNMKDLLARIADSTGQCKGCARPLFWVRHRNGKVVPYTEAGQNHFIDCPNADRWRTKK